MRVKDIDFEVFISKEEIEKIVKGLAQRIGKDYEGRNPLFVVMLNGSFVFAADFLRSLDFVADVAFVRYSSYVGMNTVGVASCDIVIPEHVKGRNVIVVEDIVDSGVTMAQFMKDIKSLNPESVALMTLLFKPDSLRENVKVDYVGKAIENRFVVGYGLDYDGLGRNLDAIYVVKE